MFNIIHLVTKMNPRRCESDRTAQYTHTISVIKTSSLMFYEEVIILCPENHINTNSVSITQNLLQLKPLRYIK